MPWQSNPYYTGGAAQKEENLAKAISSLGEIFAGPDPATQAKMMVMGAQRRKDLASAALDEDQLSARQGLGDIFSGFTTKNPDGTTSMAPEADFRAKTISALPALIRAGEGKNVRDILSVPGIASGNDALASMGSLFVRAQKPDDSFSLGDREAVAKRIATNDLTKASTVANIGNAGAMAREVYKIANTPLSTDQLKAKTLSGQYSPEQLGNVFLTNLMGSVTPRNVVLPSENGADPQSTVAIGNMFMDQGGNFKPLPFGSKVYTAQTSGKGPGEALGMTQGTTTDLQKKIVALNDITQIVDTMADYARKDPSNFGAIGNAKSTVQDLAAQGNAFGSLLQKNAANAVNSSVARGDQINPEYFNPALPAIDLLANTLAYQYAVAIAGNDRISDADYEVARRAVGDPTSWRGSAEQTLARMDTIRNMAKQRQNAYQNALAGGAAAQPLTTTVDPTTLSDDELLRRLNE